MSYSSIVWPFSSKRQGVQVPCSFCRQYNIKCDGGDPCTNCKKYNAACTYVKIQRQPRNNKPSSRNENDNNNENNVNDLSNRNDKNKTKRQRVRMACSSCRQRKKKCDGSNPCANCMKYDSVCNYVKIERQPRNNKPSSRNGNDNKNNDNNNNDRSSSDPGNTQSFSQSTNSSSLNMSSQQTGTSTRQSSNSGHRGKRSIEEVEQLPPNLPPSRRSAPSTQGIFNPNPTMTTSPQCMNFFFFFIFDYRIHLVLR
jgi:hypothetical protein